MFQKIQIKRGIRDNLTFPLSFGELAFCTDTKELFIGTSSGNHLIGGSNGGGSTITNSINNGYLVIDGIEIQVYDDSSLSLSNLTDVNLDGKTNGYVLTYNSISDNFEPKPLPSSSTGGITNLDGLTDVDFTTSSPTEGNALIFQGGIWKPGNNLSYNSLSEVELVELADSVAPSDVVNLVADSATKDKITIRWTPNDAGDVKSYKVYKNGVLETTVDYLTHIATLTNLDINTTYNVKVSTLNEYGGESQGVVLVTKTEGHALLMEGLSGKSYLGIPDLTYDEVIMVVSFSDVTKGYIYDGRLSKSLSNVNFNSSSELTLGSYFSQYYIDGVLTPSSSIRIPENKRFEFRMFRTSQTSSTGKSVLFSDYSYNNNSIGTIWDAKFLENGVVLAHYDFKTGSDLDISGQSNHLTNNGGVWI